MFNSYSSIENTYNDEFVQKIKDRGYENIKYLITEKIHGTNTQINYDCEAKTFTFGTRNRVLDEGENCYNLLTCVEPLKDSIVKLSNIIKEFPENFGIQGEVTNVILFGEQHGGFYPHKDVEKDKQAIKVQKAVYYSQHNQWRAFDIACKIADKDYIVYIPGKFFMNICKEFNIPHVPELAVVDSLTEALNYFESGESVISTDNGLPPLEHNVMEGVVIRPYDQDVFFGHHRLILKHKGDKFKEKWREKKPDIQEELPDIVKQAISEVSQFINENRADNVISHFGEVSNKDIGEIIAALSKDVLDDYKKEYGTLNCMEKSEEKMVTRYVGKEAAKVVRKVLFKQ